MRAAPAQLTYLKPHILLLDEPSNHLDIDACNALIEGLAMFKGGVFMVRTVAMFCMMVVHACIDGHVQGWRVHGAALAIACAPAGALIRSPA